MDEQQALAAPYSIEWNGKTLKFGGVIQEVKAKCVAAAKLAAMLEHKENMQLFYPGNDPETLANRQIEEDKFRANMVTGRWQWHGDLRRAWQQSTQGLTVLISAILEAGGTPLSNEEIERLAKDKYAEIIAIIALVDWDISSPKEPRPAALMALAAILTKPKETPKTQIAETSTPN